jgi:exonuclease III
MRDVRWVGALTLSLAACTDTRFVGEDEPDGFSWDDAPATGADPVRVRVAAWNVESLGTPLSLEFEAVRQVLARLDADVVVLEEVDAAEEDAFAELAAALGYPEATIARDHPFGSIGNAAMTRLPVVAFRYPSAATLSGDPAARDLTRLVPVLELEVPGAASRLGVVGTHLKSGFEPADYVRRAVDAVRTAQAADQVASVGATLVMGDFNEDLADSPASVAPLVAPVSGLPDDWILGADLAAAFEGAGLRYDPFAPLVDRGFSAVDAERRRGGTATRPSSGRRIDYAWFAGEDGARVTGAEVYSSADEAWEGLASGPVPPYDANLFAADHLPLLVEVALPSL